jgi:CheY-like chemotaxis protein
VVTDGAQAIDYLSGVDGYGDRARYPLPFLLLLDLKMPIVDGFGVLQWVRREPGLRRMLVVVLSSSDCQADVDHAYELGANSYLLKPVRFEEMAGMIQRFIAYWQEINRVPSPGASLCIPLLRSTPES